MVSSRDTRTSSIIRSPVTHIKSTMRKLIIILFAIAILGADRAEAMKYSPYKEEASNMIYNLLFCDDLDLYKANHHGDLIDPWNVLFASPQDKNKLVQLSESFSEETRFRILAYNALMKMSVPPKKKELLGVIIEVGLDDGLDTLAAYKDFSARYINFSGKMVICDQDAKVTEKIKKLLNATDPVVEKIGQWNKPRLEPPSKGIMRITILVSDGLYFVQGPMIYLQNNPFVGPVVSRATELMLELISRASQK